MKTKIQNNCEPWFLRRELSKCSSEALISGGLIFGRKFVLVTREAYIRGAYIQDLFLDIYISFINWSTELSVSHRIYVTVQFLN